MRHGLWDVEPCVLYFQVCKFVVKNILSPPPPPPPPRPEGSAVERRHYTFCSGACHDDIAGGEITACTTLQAVILKQANYLTFPKACDTHSIYKDILEYPWSEIKRRCIHISCSITHLQSGMWIHFRNNEVSALVTWRLQWQPALQVQMLQSFVDYNVSTSSVYETQRLKEVKYLNDMHEVSS
jgi:hypothetical protein